jgi:uncharacterized UPF0160 family protein
VERAPSAAAGVDFMKQFRPKVLYKTESGTDVMIFKYFRRKILRKIGVFDSKQS